MADLIQAHESNKATLQSVAQAVSPPTSPPPNPLLARGKLKKAPKPKQKSKKKDKELASTVQQVKQDELNVVSAGVGYSDAGVAGGEEADVLDLADQLLAQLDAGAGEELKPIEGLVPPTQPLHKSSSGSSTGSGGAREMLHEMKEGVNHLFHPNGEGSESPKDVEPKVSRQKARKLRKEQHYESVRKQAQEETAAENDRSVQDERDAIQAGCTKLRVRIKEINPDGHCLYSAIADQANLLGLSEYKETFASTRNHAADYLRSHPDDFMPFLTSDEDPEGIMSAGEYSRYCDTVAKTAEWGGEPEIRALAAHFAAPIHVLQAGTDILPFGEDAPPGRGPMLISYHRKMYGLGEHYNSLVPATHPSPAAAEA
ncbi:hypothetical protein BCR35DRAFT_300610 [Leucosporidium creatinivorum]|uniref:OTU domain-containing protein n=1 Tax=Leucosporidium creatinivorum TaxID=106004 RepID=A0A1Y2FZA5_9BASI|nr:hypothetical protein BCR35DRAFT_300610 [Leucosporidium creatinivorum]